MLRARRLAALMAVSVSCACSSGPVRSEEKDGGASMCGGSGAACCLGTACNEGLVCRVGLCTPLADAGQDAGRELDGGVDAGVSADAGVPDAGALDGGEDAGIVDAGEDGGEPDAGQMTDGGTPFHTSYVPPNLHPTSASRLIVMGDAIGVGLGANPSAYSYVSLLDSSSDALWPGESGTTLSSLFGTQVPLVNVAVSGATSATMLDQRATLSNLLGASVSGHSIVVITIGGGDIRNLIVDQNAQHFTTAINNVISNLRVVVQYLQDTTRFPDGTSIYLASVYDVTDGSGVLPAPCLGVPFTNTVMVPAFEQLRTRYVSLGTELGFAVVDAMGHFHGHLIGSNTSWLASDCAYPNNAGHNELRRLFFEAIDVGHYIATDL